MHGEHNVKKKKIIKSYNCTVWINNPGNGTLQRKEAYFED
jgi:hypothetical protein